MSHLCICIVLGLYLRGWKEYNYVGSGGIGWLVGMMGFGATCQAFETLTLCVGDVPSIMSVFTWTSYRSSMLIVRVLTCVGCRWGQGGGWRWL